MSPSMNERRREGSTALLTLLAGDDASEEWKDECDAAIISWSQKEEDDTCENDGYSSFNYSGLLCVSALQL